MDNEKPPSEPVRLEVEVLIDAIEESEEEAPNFPNKPSALPPINQREVL